MSTQPHVLPLLIGVVGLTGRYRLGLKLRRVPPPMVGVPEWLAELAMLVDDDALLVSVADNGASYELDWHTAWLNPDGTAVHVSGSCDGWNSSLSCDEYPSLGELLDAKVHYFGSRYESRTAPAEERAAFSRSRENNDWQWVGTGPGMWCDPATPPTAIEVRRAWGAS